MKTQKSPWGSPKPGAKKSAGPHRRKQDIQSCVPDDKQWRLLASCPKGVEFVLAGELEELGAVNVQQSIAAVYFEADESTAYKICLWTRLASRIVLVLARTHVNSVEQFRDVVASLPWSAWMDVRNSSLAVDFNGSNPFIRDSRFGAQLSKDGICDHFENLHLTRPSVNLEQPDVLVYARLYKHKLSIGIDLIGERLHKRGYRQQTGAAPIRENLAAALLRIAGWPSMVSRAKAEGGGVAFVDPMCGSGTLVIEAALMALDIAPNALAAKADRRWVIEHLRGVNQGCWQKARAEARESIEYAKGKAAKCSLTVAGFDSSGPVLEAAQSNIDACGLAGLIAIKQVSVNDLSLGRLLKQGAPLDYGLVLSNPPYGKRLGDATSLVATYRALGDWLKRDCSGWEAALFTGNPELGWETGLRSYRQHHLFNGAIPCDLQRYRIAADRFIDPASRDNAAENPGVVKQRPLGDSAAMLLNRLNKNRKKLKSWLGQSGESCYRLYDADLPEYAVAIDVYRGVVVSGDEGQQSQCNDSYITTMLHCQEYAPPATVDSRVAENRLKEVVEVLKRVFEVPSSQIVLKQRQRQRGSQQYQRQQAVTPDMWVTESGHQFRVNLSRYLDTGLFLDHRPVRRLIAQSVKGKRFLNLFAYTSAATVYAAAAGARSSVSVDLSKTYQRWSRQNFERNGLSLAQHQLVQADCLKWLNEHTSQYECILLDPPSFSNSKKMDQDWDVQRDHAALIDSCMQRLSPGGVLVFSNNRRRFKLSERVVQSYAVDNITKTTLDPDFAQKGYIRGCWRICHKC